MTKQTEIYRQVLEPKDLMRRGIGPEQKAEVEDVLRNYFRGIGGPDEVRLSPRGSTAPFNIEIELRIAVDPLAPVNTDAQAKKIAQEILSFLDANYPVMTPATRP